jgi:hypothetical protein
MHDIRPPSSHEWDHDAQKIAEGGDRGCTPRPLALPEWVPDVSVRRHDGPYQFNVMVAASVEADQRGGTPCGVVTKFIARNNDA